MPRETSIRIEGNYLYNDWASLVAQSVKRLPIMRETLVQSLGWEDPLEKEMALDTVSAEYSWYSINWHGKVLNFLKYYSKTSF